MAASGLGAFLGGLALARPLDPASSHALLPGGLALFLGGLLALSLSRNYYLALGAMALTGSAW